MSICTKRTQKEYKKELLRGLECSIQLRIGSFVGASANYAASINDKSVIDILIAIMSIACEHNFGLCIQNDVMKALETFASKAEDASEIRGVITAYKL